jgi:ribonuclease HI
MASLFNSILAEVKLSYNQVLTKGNSDMHDYKVARLFNIPLKTKSVSVRQEVHWCPQATAMIKFNCNGSSIGAQPCGAIGIVIRDSSHAFLGAISSNIGYATALEAEFAACLLASEKAMEMQLTHICLETYSTRVVNAFNKNVGVPWQMRARWFNCLKFCKSIQISCEHVLREGNQVADALAKNAQGLVMFSSQWWPAL